MRIARSASILSGLLVLFGGVASAQPLDPAALIVGVTGSPALVRAGARLPAAVGTRIQPGDSLDIPAGASLRVLYSSGRVAALTTPGPIRAASAPDRTGLFRRSIRTLASVAATDPRAMLNREGMIRPIPGSAVAIAPRNEIIVADSQPSFTWFAVPGATGYIVQLRPVGGPPVRFQAGRDTTWTAPAPLRPGVVYEWTVAALPAGRPALLQRFRTASTEEQVAVRHALDPLLPPTGLADPGTLLLAALVLQQAGFLYDARDALDRLIDAGVPVEAGVHLLHAELLAALGEEMQATAALRRAEPQR